MDIKKAVAQLDLMCASYRFALDFKPADYEGIKEMHLATEELLQYYRVTEAKKETKRLLKNIKGGK